MWDNNLPTLTEFHIRLEQLQIPAIDKMCVNGGLLFKGMRCTITINTFAMEWLSSLQSNRAQVNRGISGQIC